MNPLTLQQDNKKLFLQRNMLFIVCILMLLSNIFLSICVLGKSHRTIIVPTQLQQEFTTDGSRFSSSYIEEMTAFFLGLLLDLTPENVLHKSAIVLRHVEAESYDQLKQYFQKEDDTHKKYGLSSNFSINRIHEIGPLEYEVSGVLSSRFGETGKKDTQASYVIKYKNRFGRLLLEKFEKK